MFGNLIGWLISAGIALFTATGLFFMQRTAEHYATTAGDLGPLGHRAAQLRVAAPVDPRSLATWMTEEADSTELFKQAIADFEEHSQFLIDFNGQYPDAEAGTAPANRNIYVKAKLALLLKASPQKSGTLFGGAYDKAITFESQRLPLTGGLYHVQEAAGSRAAILLGQWRKARDANDPSQQSLRDEARNLYRALYSLGVKMWEERVVQEQLFFAKKALDVSSYFLAELSDSEAEKAKWKDFNDQLSKYYSKQVHPIWQFVGTHKPYYRQGPSGPVPGLVDIGNGEKAGYDTWVADCIEIARKSPEMMWRVEATMSLGRARFAAPTEGALFAATQALNTLVNDPDARIKLAARRALDLTEEGYRKATSKIWEVR